MRGVSKPVFYDSCVDVAEACRGVPDNILLAFKCLKGSVRAKTAAVSQACMC